jgi:5-methylcytosine-specific restriction endonuclease McrA
MAWSKLSRHKRGYDHAWVKLRLHIMARDKYLCQECLKEGRTTLANQVDHILSKAKGGKDNMNNLQSLCEPCHDRKTIEETGKTFKPKVKIGIDGFPIESNNPFEAKHTN